MYRPNPVNEPRYWQCGACGDARPYDDMRRCDECDTRICKQCERKDGARCAVCVVAEELTHDA